MSRSSKNRVGEAARGAVLQVRPTSRLQRSRIQLTKRCMILAYGELTADQPHSIQAVDAFMTSALFRRTALPGHRRRDVGEMAHARFIGAITCLMRGTTGGREPRPLADNFNRWWAIDARLAIISPSAVPPQRWGRVACIVRQLPSPSRLPLEVRCTPRRCTATSKGTRWRADETSRPLCGVAARPDSALPLLAGGLRYLIATAVGPSDIGGELPAGCSAPARLPGAMSQPDRAAGGRRMRESIPVVGWHAHARRRTAACVPSGELSERLCNN